ncbi:hypothetical protein BDW02DRAFT_86730 [Decorospora gaudefroyi]|uniref:Uncharacterized protein n=1 Tax=Decorospora gaudefroyi TaxID=184978 RepID=A0A6A5K1C7_9PLEO|nr:hypothetical protein BDW02DRAFT_86730 [Decorospora gaudefroyi]
MVYLATSLQLNLAPFVDILMACIFHTLRCIVVIFELGSVGRIGIRRLRRLSHSHTKTWHEILRCQRICTFGCNNPRQKSKRCGCLTRDNFVYIHICGSAARETIPIGPFTRHGKIPQKDADSTPAPASNHAPYKALALESLNSDRVVSLSGMREHASRARTRN